MKRSQGCTVQHWVLGILEVFSVFGAPGLNKTFWFNPRVAFQLNAALQSPRRRSGSRRGTARLTHRSKRFCLGRVVKVALGRLHVRPVLLDRRKGP